MAYFNWNTFEIVLTGGTAYQISRNDLTEVPQDGNSTVILVHEYVHFIQSISSICGIRVLAELINLGVTGALLLSGVGQGSLISKRYPILKMLRNLPDHAGVNNPILADRLRYFSEQRRILFQTPIQPYCGDAVPWSLETQIVTEGRYVEQFVGIVTPNKMFRPITPRMLAEGMARRIDRWIKMNHGFDYPNWPSHAVEDELYNGIWNVLSQEQYSHNIVPETLDRITVTVCWLALACERPDFAVAVMLGRLKQKKTAGGTTKAIAIELRDLLRRPNVGLLRTHSFNEVIRDLHYGAANVMMRNEFVPVFRQLQSIFRASSTVFSQPTLFADDSVTWERVVQWMSLFSIPRVVAVDGNVDAIAEVSCSPNVSDFLTEFWRVFS